MNTMREMFKSRSFPDLSPMYFGNGLTPPIEKPGHFGAGIRPNEQYNLFLIPSWLGLF